MDEVVEEKCIEFEVIGEGTRGLVGGPPIPHTPRIYQKLSCNQKAAHNKHIHELTSGTTSSAQKKKVEYINTMERKLGYVEFFDFTHRRNETYAKDKSALFMDFAKKKMEEYNASGKFHDKYDIHREAWDFCMGDDALGRAPGFGVSYKITSSRISCAVNGYEK